KRINTTEIPQYFTLQNSNFIRDCPSNRKAFVYHETVFSFGGEKSGASVGSTVVIRSRKVFFVFFLFFFFIYQYRQSLLASVEHETISAKSVLLAFWCVRSPCLLPPFGRLPSRTRRRDRSSACASRRHRPLNRALARPVPPPIDCQMTSRVSAAMECASMINSSKTKIRKFIIHLHFNSAMWHQCCRRRS
ncbi:hypothetical protein AGLY_004867, partial [Aphis glycines]